MKRMWLMILGLLLTVSILASTEDVYAEARQADGTNTVVELTANEQDGLLIATLTGKRLQDVYAYELLLEYDPLRLELVSARSVLSGFTLEPIREGYQTLIAHTKIGNVPGVSGDMPLVTLHFKRIRGGDTAVSLTEARLVDSSLALTTLKLGERYVYSDSRQPAQWVDVAGHWAEQSIRTALELGYVSGYGDGSFRPDRPVTRAEFATMLARALLLEAAHNLSFKDSAEIPGWARASVAASVKSGFIRGYEDGTFRADRYINRSEIAVMIMRTVTAQPDSQMDLKFTDAADIPEWAKPSVRQAVEQGLLQGKGGNRLAPLAQATRAEAVSLILSMLYKKAGL
jgi:hypothetical protein